MSKIQDPNHSKLRSWETEYKMTIKCLTNCQFDESVYLVESNERVSDHIFADEDVRCEIVELVQKISTLGVMLWGILVETIPQIDCNPLQWKGKSGPWSDSDILTSHSRVSKLSHTRMDEDEKWLLKCSTLFLLMQQRSVCWIPFSFSEWYLQQATLPKVATCWTMEGEDGEKGEGGSGRTRVTQTGVALTKD